MVSQRARELKDSVILDFLKKVEVKKATGAVLTRFDIGMPAFGCPEPIQLAVAASLFMNQTGYEGISLGIEPLRKVIAEETNAQWGSSYSEKNVLVCPGSIAGLAGTLFTTCDPLDELLITDPCWEIYGTQAQAFGIVPVRVALEEKDKWNLDVGGLCARITPKTKALLINSPGNPTGAVISQNALETIARSLKERASGAYLISDEVYGGIVFGERSSVAALQKELSERVIIVNSFSKTHAMAGLRIGYVIGPEEEIKYMEKFARNLWIAVSSITQRGTARMLSDARVKSYVEEMRKEYLARRDIVMTHLARAGISCVLPEGAFYAFPKVDGDSTKLAEFLLEQKNITVIPGACFGQQGEGHIRVSYAQIKTPLLGEAMERLVAGIKEYSSR